MGLRRSIHLVSASSSDLIKFDFGLLKEKRKTEAKRIREKFTERIPVGFNLDTPEMFFFSCISGDLRKESS